MRRRWWRWLRPLTGALLLVALVTHVGPDSLVAGVRGLDAGTLLAGAALAAFCTACASWRWTVLARACGLSLSFRVAVVAYYRSQLLNATLPGGVLGDVDRAVWHARDQHDVPRAGGVIIVERSVGQAVLMLVTVVILLLWGADTGLSHGLVGALAAGCLVFGIVALVVGGATGGARGLRGRVVAAVTLASLLAAAGYALTFLLAAYAVGAPQPLHRMIPLALVVIVGSAIPVNFAGWGPREGVAAWVFASAGMGAELGVSVSVAYGLISLAAVLPGVVPLLVGRKLPGVHRRAPDLPRTPASAVGP